MAAFNPDIPETQEPNYLRYSRPSNYAPVNKAAGEAIKAIGQVTGQTGRAADSVVTEGIKSSVSSQAQAYSEEHIAGLEQRYSELLNPNPSNTPRDIQNLPGKIDALDSAKERSSFVQAQYDSKLYTLAKDMRTKFPGYRDIIDREVNRASGQGMANPYARALQSGISAIEGKIDNEQKRKENIVDTFTKEGNISPVMRSAYDQGKLSADYLIHEGVTRAWQNKGLEMAARRNAYQESEYKLHAVEAEHNADHARDIALSQTMKDVAVSQGTETTPKFMEYKAALESGKKQYLTPEEQNQFNQSLDLAKNRATSAYSKYLVDSGLAEKMGSDVFTRKQKEFGEAWDYYAGLGESKNYVQQHSFQKWMETKTEGEQMARELSDTGQMLKRGAAVVKMGGNQAWVERQVGEIWGSDKAMGQGVKSLLTDNFYGATTGLSNKDGGSAPSVHPDINKLNAMGFKGDAKQINMNFGSMLDDPKVPDEAKKSLVDYQYGGDGVKLIGQLTTQTSKPGGKNYTTKSMDKISVFEESTKEKRVNSIYNLGGNAWNVYKDYVDKGIKTVLGSEIPNLNKAAERGYQFSYDSTNHTIDVKPGTATPGGYKTFPMGEVNKDVKNINRVLQGIKNVAAKEPNVDVNAYLLKILQEGGLGDNEASKAIMKSILASHKSSALTSPQGEVLSDTGDQMGMGSTAMNIPVQPPVAGEKAPERLMTQFPARTQAPGPVNIKEAPSVPGTFNPAELGKQVKPELPFNFIPTSRGLEMPPQPAEPLPAKGNIDKPEVKALSDRDSTQKKLDRVLKKAGDVAKEHTAAVEESYRKAEENIFTRESSASSILARFKDHPREEELLQQKIDSLKLRAKNFGPKGPQGQLARQDIKLIQKRLKDINVERVGNQMEKDIGDTVKKEFK